MEVEDQGLAESAQSRVLRKVPHLYPHPFPTVAKQPKSLTVLFLYTDFAFIVCVSVKYIFVIFIFFVLVLQSMKLF